MQLKKGKQLVAKHNHRENFSYCNQELFTQSIKLDWKKWHKGNMPWIMVFWEEGITKEHWNIATDKWLMVGSNAFSVPKCMGWCRWCWAEGVLGCVCVCVGWISYLGKKRKVKDNVCKLWWSKGNCQHRNSLLIDQTAFGLFHFVMNSRRFGSSSPSHNQRQKEFPYFLQHLLGLLY